MDYIIHIGIFAGIFAIAAVSLNLLVGYTGIVSVAHIGFFAIGAYVVGIATTMWEIHFFFALGLGVMIAGVAAFLLGLVLSRFRDDLYLLASVGFAIIMHSVLLNWDELTRGPLGIPGIPRPNIFGLGLQDNTMFFVLTLVVLGAVFFASRFIVQSSFGRALMGIREDEKALEIFGYHATHYKLIIFVIASGMAALGGGLLASYIRFIDPSISMLHDSIFMLAIIILGGLASLKGSVLGAVILIFLPETLRFVGFPPDIAGQMRQVAYGVLLVVLMLYKPQGFCGAFKL